MNSCCQWKFPAGNTPNPPPPSCCSKMIVFPKAESQQQNFQKYLKIQFFYLIFIKSIQNLSFLSPKIRKIQLHVFEKYAKIMHLKQCSKYFLKIFENSPAVGVSPSQPRRPTRATPKLFISPEKCWLLHWMLLPSYTDILKYNPNRSANNEE